MVTVGRRLTGVLGCVVLGASFITACSSSSEEGANQSDGEGITVTDVAGREVHFDSQPERIILGESRGVFATAALDQENPLDKVVAMGTDLQNNVPDYWNRLVEKIPSAADIPEIGNFKKGDVTVENLVSLDPDVIVLSQGQYESIQTAGITDQLDNAGLKYVVTDFRTHPLTNTTKSVDLFGELLGKEDAAEAFDKEWQRVVDLVKERAAKADTHPTTYVWRAAGLLDCCSSWNNANISELVNVAGGKNIGDDFIDGESGSITPEKVIEQQPEVVIATGGDWSAQKDDDGNPAKFAAAGYDISEDEAKASLEALPGIQPGFELLEAPKDGNLYAIWHQFYDSPFNYMALLQIAKWLHPDDYSDIDISAEWEKAHEQFAPFDGDGAFFVSTK